MTRPDPVRAAIERAYHFAISAETELERAHDDPRVAPIYRDAKAARKAIGAALAELIVREETEVLFTS